MATIREQYEQLQEKWFAPAASRSQTATRCRSEEPSPIRTEYQRDRDRIVHSRAFRRLKSKTQVFLPPSGDHIRTRLTHTLEVTQIARTISRALHLNEDLTEAIGLAHDLGHTPFGHAGEQALGSVFPGFRHNEQSLRVVDVLEKDGNGLNLTTEVRDGVLRHSKPASHLTGELAGRAMTAEGQVVKIADVIAYISHDLDDALTTGFLDPSELPASTSEILGDRHSKRINSLVESVIEHSAPILGEPVNGRQVIVLGSLELQAADDLRRFLFTELYEPINGHPSTKHAREIVVRLFEYYSDRPDEIDSGFNHGDTPERRAADVVSGMTDTFARRRHQELFVPVLEEI